MTDLPMVPVSWGELIDKLTILDIKRVRLRAASAVADVERERAFLVQAMAVLNPPPDGLEALQSELAAINDRLWAIEDAIREKEAAGVFDDGFIALARSVYQQNDERGRVKRAINDLLGSDLVEQKQYARY
jgi:3-methyladenine DNA glycosylase/8-oxoguanine DNA glycosylase